MKYLIMFLLSLPALANTTSCYTTGSITSCTDGSSMYDFGNMKQIISPNHESTTVYQYGNQTQVISPSSYQNRLNNYQFGSPVLQPSLGSPLSR